MLLNLGCEGGLMMVDLNVSIMHGKCLMILFLIL